MKFLILLFVAYSYTKEFYINSGYYNDAEHVSGDYITLHKNNFTSYYGNDFTKRVYGMWATPAYCDTRPEAYFCRYDRFTRSEYISEAYLLWDSTYLQKNFKNSILNLQQIDSEQQVDYRKNHYVVHGKKMFPQYYKFSEENSTINFTDDTVKLHVTTNKKQVTFYNKNNKLIGSADVSGHYLGIPLYSSTENNIHNNLMISYLLQTYYINEIDPSLHLKPLNPEILSFFNYYKNISYKKTCEETYGETLESTYGINS